MEFIAITAKGIEDIAMDEINSLLKAKPKKIKPGRILFSSKTPLQSLKLSSILRVYSLHKKFNFKSLKDLLKKAEKINFDFVNDPFVVRCYREGIHPFLSQQVSIQLGDIIFKQGHSVDLKSPQTVVYAEIIGKTCFLGELLFDNLQKRDYRLRRSPGSISSIIAYSLLKFAKWKKKEVLVDPFCKDGVIPIEAALLGGKNIFGFDDSLNNVRNARINAKLAGVDINLGKAEINWLDTKFEHGSVDKIITFPPFPSKTKKQEEIENIYKDFFYQASYVLKKKGSITLISPYTKLLLKCADSYGFNPLLAREIFQGKSNYFVIVLKP